MPSLFNGSLYVTIIRREGGKLSIALNRQGTSELMRILGDLVSQLPSPTPTRAADIPGGAVPATG
ncbi:MAG: hypothetical protein HYT80_03380 [Euryarchaeota archaeon]|nr:hypothetical protein [Euryarchaeota archaeon]